MNNEKMVNNVPENATHIDAQGFYFNCLGQSINTRGYDIGVKTNLIGVSCIDDIKRILELEEINQRLSDKVEDLELRCTDLQDDYDEAIAKVADLEKIISKIKFDLEYVPIGQAMQEIIKAVSK